MLHRLRGCDSQMAFFWNNSYPPKPGVPNTSRWQQISCSWKLPGLVVLLIVIHTPGDPPIHLSLYFSLSQALLLPCLGSKSSLSRLQLPPTARACAEDTSVVKGSHERGWRELIQHKEGAPRTPLQPAVMPWCVLLAVVSVVPSQQCQEKLSLKRI